MQKINFILFLMLLSTGCSVIKEGGNRNYGVSNEIIIENIKKQNITANSFNIQKAEIEINIDGKTKKLLGNIKFEYPDKYLLSLKSNTGIEVFRIFISDDTILVKDRINRIQYYGSPQYLRRKYGITASVLPILFGDCVTDNYYGKDKEKCLNGKLNFNGFVNGIRINYLIDCKQGKTIIAVPENGLNEDGIEIIYDEFFGNGDTLTSGRIEIKDFKRRITIKIRIKEIDSNWKGKIEFIPGIRYELIQLL